MSWLFGKIETLEEVSKTSSTEIRSNQRTVIREIQKHQANIEALKKQAKTKKNRDDIRNIASQIYAEQARIDKLKGQHRLLENNKSDIHDTAIDRAIYKGVASSGRVFKKAGEPIKGVELSDSLRDAVAQKQEHRMRNKMMSEVTGEMEEEDEEDEIEEEEKKKDSKMERDIDALCDELRAENVSTLLDKPSFSVPVSSPIPIPTKVITQPSHHPVMIGAYPSQYSSSSSSSFSSHTTTLPPLMPHPPPTSSVDIDDLMRRMHNLSQY